MVTEHTHTHTQMQLWVSIRTYFFSSNAIIHLLVSFLLCWSFWRASGASLNTNRVYEPQWPWPINLSSAMNSRLHWRFSRSHSRSWIWLCPFGATLCIYFFQINKHSLLMQIWCFLKIRNAQIISSAKCKVHLFGSFRRSPSFVSLNSFTV